MNENANNQAKIEQNRAKGSVGFKIYRKYFKAGGGLFTFIVTMIFCILSQLLASGGDYYVNYW